MPLIRRSNKEAFCFEKSCKFIGSLAISLLKGIERQAFVNEKLLEMKDVGKGISVVLHVNDEGIKVLKDDKSAVKMAHGITKVLFSTCHPDQRLFAYVVKTPAPNGKVVTQAHMFRTTKSKHTQELSASISRGFKIAYGRNTLKRQNQGDQFEKEAESIKEKINAQKKHWAKGELAHGHDNAAHALRARGYKSTRNDEPPSYGIKKLVDSLDKEQKSKGQAELSPQKNNQNIQRNDKLPFSSGANEIPRSRKLSPAKILPGFEEEFNINPQPIAIPRSQKFSSEDYKDMALPPPVHQQKEVFDLRKVSNKSASFDDSDIVPESPGNVNNSVSNFVFPAPKFGAIEEHIPVSQTPSIAKPVSRFVNLPDSEDEEGDERVDWEYVNIAQTKSVAVALEVKEEVNKIKAKNTVNPNTAEDVKNKVNIVPDNVGSTSGSGGNAKKRSRKKKLRDIPLTNRMTLSEEKILKDSEWYQPGFSRSIAEEILKNRPTGSFFIRDSTSHPGSFVMTMRVSELVKESQVMNYLIVQDRDALYRIKGFSNIFPGLTYLVAHYSSIDEDIPCRLYLSSNNPLFENGDSGEKEEVDHPNFDFLLDEECDDQDYINFSSNADICRELDEICFL